MKSNHLWIAAAAVIGIVLVGVAGASLTQTGERNRMRTGPAPASMAQDHGMEGGMMQGNAMHDAMAAPNMMNNAPAGDGRHDMTDAHRSMSGDNAASPKMAGGDMATRKMSGEMMASGKMSRDRAMNSPAMTQKSKAMVDDHASP